MLVCLYTQPHTTICGLLFLRVVLTKCNPSPNHPTTGLGFEPVSTRVSDNQACVEGGRTEQQHLSR